MADRDIEISDRSSDADIAELPAALNEYNFATTGYRDGRSLSASSATTASSSRASMGSRGEGMHGSICSGWTSHGAVTGSERPCWRLLKRRHADADAR